MPSLFVNTPHIPGYRLIRKLGRGGMATVYLAEQEALKCEVALKIILPSLASDPGFARRFQRDPLHHNDAPQAVDSGP